MRARALVALTLLWASLSQLLVVSLNCLELIDIIKISRGLASVYLPAWDVDPLWKLNEVLQTLVGATK